MLFWPRVGLLLRSALSVCLFRLTLQRCLPEYRKTEGHTACLPRNYECDIVSSGLTPAEQKSFVDVHNKYRSMVARGRLPRFPPASDMRKLRWDDGLAEVAEAHAKQCNVRHDAGRHRSTVKFPRTGQNLAAYWKSNGATNGSSSWVGNDIERAVRSWFEENHRYSPSGLNHFSENAVGPVGHFAQVIWASTQFVGCGAVRFRKHGGRGGATNFYVCNYADAGNHVGKPVYLPGRACSHCPRGMACEWPAGLCTGSSFTAAYQTARSSAGTSVPAAMYPSSTAKIGTWRPHYGTRRFWNGSWYPYSVSSGATRRNRAWMRHYDAQRPWAGKLTRPPVYSIQTNKMVTWKPPYESDSWAHKWPLGFWKTREQSFNILREVKYHLDNSGGDFAQLRFGIDDVHDVYINRPERVSVTVFRGYDR
nr:CRISP/Allergen/PR-1-like [Dermacentor andersoni]